MKIHLLGVSGPFPESGGATSGYLVQTEQSLIQLEFGSGILSRLTARTAPEGLDAVLLSHWHFDHAADLPVLMYRLDALGAVLSVYAPEDNASALRKIVASSPSFRLITVAPGDEFAVGDCTVRVGEARHPVPAVGFRLSVPGADFGYTGDTNTLPSLAGFYRGCDCLLADGLFPSESWTEQKPHLSAALAAKLASQAGCKRLVLTHLNPLIPTNSLLTEARAEFGNVSLASAGVTLTV